MIVAAAALAAAGVACAGAIAFIKLNPGESHDAGRVAAATGQAPTAGFFAQGELGPVGGRNFLHTFTASMAVFCEAGDPL